MPYPYDMHGDPFIRKHWKRMLAIVLLTFGLLVACTQSGDPAQERGFFGDVGTYHDQEHEVTCWMWTWTTEMGGISCLPDAEVNR